MKCITEKIRIVAVVEPPLKLIEIGVKMLCADYMINTRNRPL
jgi:hypothetical protein